MPPSQLKRLKASLREQGLAGGQKSKKQKKQDTGRNVDQRVQKQAALQSIRDSFNPFEVKKSARPAKFQSTSRDAKPASVARPGVTRSMGEEARRATLLPEIQRRNKTGGIIDRRIGENDPTMTPEERALQRFAREKQRKKGGGLFDLEEVDDGEDFLTHGGKSLTFDGAKDDFDMSGISADEEDGDDDDDQDRPLKRRRPSADEGDDQDEDMSDVEQDGDRPARKKTKAEVMKEVIAKSKLHKYERQKTKEDDDDLREELDQGLQDMLDLLRGHKPPPKQKQIDQPQHDINGMNPERLAMIQGKSDAEKDYDMRLKQMAMDKRAAPTERTKTEEEVAAQEAIRLKEAEESRLRRMQGDESEDDEEHVRGKSTKAPVGVDDMSADEDYSRDDAAEFGLPNQLPADETIVLEDEDDFLLEDDIVAGGSDIDTSEGSGESDNDESDDGAENQDAYEDEEDEFVRGILGGKDDADSSSAFKKAPSVPEPATGLAYTYACPRSHEELLVTFGEIAVDNIPTVVQRIRALYHPSLSAENKEKLADFSVALINHISYMAKEKQPLRIIETLIRHIHSLSRTYPETIANAFRKHLSAFHERGTPTAGDLVILTAIGTVYPTSDHFHQVVTPAITLMARWLEMTPPTTPYILATGAFMVALCVKYQQFSKRYIPEAVRFTTKALQTRPSPELLTPHITNLLSMADLWSTKSSFVEIFSPAALTALQTHKGTKAPSQRLAILLQQSKLLRRPLALHNHKPLAIRTSIPKFEDNFNPDKHYDPDQERSEASKLRKEYKREKKGAVRELRKDANFVAREQLREKKERDAEYEKKYKRLVAEIQGEEGHESKAYEREKRMRKSKR